MTNAANQFSKLESALVQAGRELEYPATPPLAARVRAELANTAPPAPIAWGRVLVPLAAAIVLALILLFAIPTARDAVAQLLGLRGLIIIYPTVTPMPTLTSTLQPTSASAFITATSTPPIPTPVPTRVATAQKICCETTLADAQRRANFTLRVPPNATPSIVYFQNIFDQGVQVVMVFGEPANPRFTLYQAQWFIYGKLLGKQVDAGTQIGEARVNGLRALWISGAPHVIVVLDANGQPIFDTARTVDANTLAWETDNSEQSIIYRLETKLPLDEALKFAESLYP